MSDTVNHPAHYTQGPPHSECGKPIECIDVSETLGFNLGNALKYMWRADLKGSPVEDLRKARWYLDREIARRRGAEKSPDTILAIPNGTRVIEVPSIRSGTKPLFQAWCDSKGCHYAPLGQVFDADDAAQMANEHYQREHVGKRADE